MKQQSRSQKTGDGRQQHCVSPSPRLPLSPSPSQPGFTLIELMVVIAIIVLGMTLAIPAIRSLTGSRSVEAAENSVGSFINFTRTEAIGLQRTEGVMFLLDIAADRVKCVAVMDTGLQSNFDVPGVTYLDLVPDRDPLFLPTGIRLWTVKDTPPDSSFTDPITPGVSNSNTRYLGFDPDPNMPPSNAAYHLTAPAPQMTSVPGGVILFDKTGHLVSVRYGLRLNVNSQLGQMIYPTISTLSPPPQDWPNQNNSTAQDYLASQVSLALFDRETFLAQSASGSQFTEYNDPTGGSLEAAMESWLNTNTASVIINRYDGSLMRAE